MALLIAARSVAVVVWLRQRDSLDRQSQGVRPMRRYLVVANQTLGGPELADKLEEEGYEAYVKGGVSA